ncbi:MAG: hypothetical protein AB1801_14345 [Chloroflexota bacterium]
MAHPMRKLCSILIIVGLVFITVACGPAKSGADIQPIGSLEAQAAPPTAAPVESEPSPTAMPAEISEPVSPVLPVSPLKEPAMAQSTQTAKPIPGSEQALAAAIAHLAEKAGVPAEEIKLISMEAVEWSDASLGCPQPGYMYAQVITPGYLIILEAQGEEYEYHTDQKTNVVLCPPE